MASHAAWEHPLGKLDLQIGEEVFLEIFRFCHCYRSKKAKGERGMNGQCQGAQQALYGQTRCLGFRPRYRKTIVQLRNLVSRPQMKLAGDVES